MHKEEEEGEDEGEEGEGEDEGTEAILNSLASASQKWLFFAGSKSQSMTLRKTCLSMDDQ